MKTIIDKIITIEYDIAINKYVAWCRVKVGNKWKYQKMFFNSVDEWERLNNNDINNKYESKD